ncbi:MAG: hypothetical protein PWP23_254 [Candidatus Sumerlaeota bacterium]|nr:hypothetical protein [Candidatus Sumerlaeota bacterium]
MHSTRFRIHQKACIVAALAVGALSLPRASSSAIEGSAHDFSAIDPNEQICIFCHTAHNADTSVVDAPLWNHATTNRTYQVYNSPSLDATVAQPSGESRLCLSCHDGTVAVDSYGGNAGVIFLGGDLAIGADELTNDHPVSFVYDDALAATDGELHEPSGTPSGLGSTISDDMLFNNRMECASCHDVHNGASAEVIDDNLLVISQTSSQLCLTCHDK